MSGAQDEQKAKAGRAAAALVEPGMTVGLGTGSTAALFVRALAERRLDIRAVATSNATAALATSLGIEVVDLDEARDIDLTIDGADEIGPELALIKGGGAALLREKLVWEASRRCVAIADESKLGAPFGRFPLPVEVVAFGHLTTAARMTRVLADLDLDVDASPIEPRLRLKDGAPLVTDGGNLIYDLALGRIGEPELLEAALKSLTGVVEHGLFLGLAERALVARADRVETLWP
ncbi:MAG TPA: ribose-5-phosphate isomerase RpiA [Caulobacteraceae bacterium]|nr:ribose-5-phosphate isomerase RpiA [Caulobacteraceae bacterium]